MQALNDLLPLHAVWLRAYHTIQNQQADCEVERQREVQFDPNQSFTSVDGGQAHEHHLRHVVLHCVSNDTIVIVEPRTAPTVFPVLTQREREGRHMVSESLVDCL